MKKFLLIFLFPSLVFAAGGFAVETLPLVTQTVTTTSAVLVPKDVKRTYLLIQNVGSTSIIIKNLTVQSGSEGITIPAGGNYEPAKGITDVIYAKSASGSNQVNILTGR